MEKETVEIPGLLFVSIALILILAIGFCLIFFIFFAKRKQHFRQKKILEVQFQQALLQTQIEIQEQTLKTISQEIHDNIGQVLSLAKLNLNTLKPEETIKLNDTKQLVSKAINDLRDLSRSLHGDKIAELGLPDAIDNELKILQNTGQFNTQFKTKGHTYKLTPQKEMVLFRIVQEAMNNAVKHSRAKNITVQLQYEPSQFILTISDDGDGFDTVALPAAQKGIGLNSMQNRAALIGGTFSIQSTQGNGTVINISLAHEQQTINHKP